jgi:hypothetical protein
MIIDLLLDFGNPTMKSIEMPTNTIKKMGKGYNAPIGFIASPLCYCNLESLTFYHKGMHVLLHAFPKVRSLAHVICFLKPRITHRGRGVELK